MHWWSGDISARERIETNLRSTLSQPNNFSLYTVFVFCGCGLSRKTRQQLTSQAESALSSVSAICSLSTMKCVYMGFFIVKTSLSLLNVLTYYTNKGSKQCDCGPFSHQEINIYSRATENQLSLDREPGDNELRGFIRRRSKGIIRFNAPFHFQTV